jgi:GxxExxY protein
MPIAVGTQLRVISQDEFHGIDRKVMSLAFDVHRELGRFCDETIYQTELACRCRESGFGAVSTEVPIRACYQDFTKTYFADLMVEQSAMFELKTAAAITQEHRKQALNYLLLMGLNHGKVINFRPASVEYEFVSTKLTSQRRRQFTTNLKRWLPLDSDSEWLRRRVGDLAADWGVFLDVELFYEALVHFRGGEKKVIQRIALEKNGRRLGRQRAHLLNHAAAFKLSAITRNTAAFERRLRKFLALTQLQAIQWINFNHHIIEFTTITK